jgi:hypothetical protein
MRLLAQKLLDLRNNEKVNTSKIPKTIIPQLDRWVKIGALSYNTTKRGSSYSIRNIDIFDSEVSRLYPNGLDSATQKQESRKDKVLVLKDAKGGGRITYPHLHIQLAGALELQFQEGSGQNSLKDKYFSLTLLYRELKSWNFSGVVVLVENQESFMKARLKFSNADVIIWYEGRVDNRLQNWLVRNDVNVIFCPDYDPVGIDEYSKLKNQLNDSVSLYLPATLEEDFQYSTPSLLDKQNSRKILARLENTLDLDLDSRNVLSLIQKWNAGLMQEYYF